MSYIIYKYTSPSKRTYIGLTCDEQRRKKEHMQSEFNESVQTKFARALRKYGFNKFSYEVIDHADTWQELGPKEKHWIKFYDSVNSGYNIGLGGLSNPIYKLTDKQVEDMQLLLRIGELTQKQIAEYFSVSEGVVSVIKNGKGTRNLQPTKRTNLVRKGSANNKAKLTEKQIIEIKQRIQNGEKRRDLQNEYGVSKTLIQMLATNQIWNHVQTDYTYKKKETNGNAKLTADIVKELKKDMLVMERKSVAEKYGISVPTVDQIKAGKTWKDV